MDVWRPQQLAARMTWLRWSCAAGFLTRFLPDNPTLAGAGVQVVAFERRKIMTRLPLLALLFGCARALPVPPQHRQPSWSRAESEDDDPNGVGFDKSRMTSHHSSSTHSGTYKRI